VFLKIKNIPLEKTDNIELFTDGSYEPQINYGAWAALILKNQKEQVLSGESKDSSQHKMELQAVIKGLNYIIKNYGYNNTIYLYTDSEYVENLMHRKEKLIRNDFLTKKGKFIRHSAEIKQFFALEEQVRLTITQVPGHQKKGVSRISDYNRRVDKLARKLVKNRRKNS
jgi:ribonuclease HI